MAKPPTVAQQLADLLSAGALVVVLPGDYEALQGLLSSLQPQREPDDGIRAVSVAEAARRLGVSRTTVFKLLREGRLPSVQIGDRRLVSVAAIEAFIEAGGDAA
ncbi:MAG: helix-turn-helix domain-containing protein [Acidimicrobiales bacterium]